MQLKLYKKNLFLNYIGKKLILKVIFLKKKLNHLHLSINIPQKSNLHNNSNNNNNNSNNNNNKKQIIFQENIVFLKNIANVVINTSGGIIVYMIIAKNHALDMKKRKN